MTGQRCLFFVRFEKYSKSSMKGNTLFIEHVLYLHTLLRMNNLDKITDCHRSSVEYTPRGENTRISYFSAYVCVIDMMDVGLD